MSVQEEKTEEHKCQRFEKKGGQLCTPKISILIGKGVHFSLKICGKGSFFKSENADMSSLSESSAGSGKLATDCIQ